MTARNVSADVGRLMSILILTFVVPLFACAQNTDNETDYVTMRLHTVKPGQNAAWESLMKERRDAELAAGRQFRRVFQRVRGPSNGYLILHPDLDMGTTDIVPDISPTWFQRLDATLKESTTLTLQTYPEISANLERWLTKDTDMLRVRLRTTPPDRRQDYHDWQANELTPALKKDGSTFRGGRVILGGNENTWVRMFVVADWKYLTTPTPEFNTDEFRQMIARGDAMSTTKISYLYQYRAELSFVAE